MSLKEGKNKGKGKYDAGKKNRMKNLHCILYTYQANLCNIPYELYGLYKTLYFIFTHLVCYEKFNSQL